MALGPDRPGDALAARVDGIAAWIHDLDERVRAAEVASGDEKTARELRRAIEALSKHDPKLEKRLTNRVDVLADRLATLASTVSTAAASIARKDGEIATLRREIEDGNKRLESLLKQVGKGAGADELAKVRSAVQALQAERPARGGDARVEAVEGKLVFLGERIDTLASTVATTAAGLVGREGEIANLRERFEQGSARIEQTVSEIRRLQGSAPLADRLDGLQRTLNETREGLAGRERDVAALRGRIDEAYARVGTVVSEMQASISTLSEQVAGLESLPAATEEALDARTTELNERLDGVAALLESVTQATAGRDEELERIGSVVSRLQGQLAKLPAATETRAAALDARLDELAAAFESGKEGAAERDAELDRLGSLVARVQEELAKMPAATEQALDARTTELTQRVDELATALQEELAQLPPGDSAVEARVTQLGERVEELAAAAEAREDPAPALRALATRLETTESGHTTVSAEVARIAQTLDSERRAVRAELDRLAATVSSDESAIALAALRDEVDAVAAALASAPASPALGELTARLERLERAGASVAADVARTTAFWAAELEAVEGKLDALAAAPTPALAAPAEPDPALRTAVAAVEQRVDDLAGHLAQLASEARDAAPPPPNDDLTELQVAVDGLRMRLASSEQELATLVGSRDLATRIEELTRRIDAVERAPIALAPADGGAGAGDGRFRLELRALELRMEHAEAASRENREAVLVQLERLAARIEWRFQRLEAEYEARHPHAVGGGRVVPLRPQAEV